MATIFQIDKKRRVSRVGVKSGIDARAEALPHERSAELEQLAADYMESFHPSAPEERFWVDLLIRADWRMRRLAKAESETWLNERIQRRIDATENSYRLAVRELQRLRSDGRPWRGTTLSAAALPQPSELENVPALPATAPSDSRFRLSAGLISVFGYTTRYECEGQGCVGQQYRV
ncbi:MAG: hypothetical protein JO307_06540 [Bryobacterales bacterium]|nr:hypothetical protein [Bryobacterales bacterium]